jgi:3,4-dihydroxy 2-butanone 4-phosphate synthase/GTP cyclohydrolase II
MRAIEVEGRGVVVLIRDLGAKSVSDWIQRQGAPAASAKDAHGRRQVEIGVGSQILRDLGITDMVLLTNSPADVYVGLEGFGLRITGTRPIE